MTPIRCSLVASLALVATRAQTSAVAPPEYAEHWGVVRSHSPWRASFQTAQLLVNRAGLPPQLTVGRGITQIGWRPSRGQPARFGRSFPFQIGLYDTSLTDATLQTNFAANQAASSGRIVFDQVISLPTVDYQNPTRAFHMLPLQAPYTFQGPNLLVHADCRDSLNFADTWFIDGCGAFDTATVALGNTNCGAARAGVLPGQSTYGLQLFSAPAGTAAIGMFATSIVSSAGLPLPIALDALGASGCSLLVDPIVSVPVAADAQGNVQLNFPYGLIPKLYLQWLVNEPGANALGWTSTQAVGIYDGAIPCPMSSVWAFPSAASGVRVREGWITQIGLQ